MSLLERFLKVVQAQAHSLLKRFEDPIKLTEQGIRDLKKDFDDSMKSVAQIKAIAIGTRKNMETKKQIAADYERKALIILKKGQSGELDQAEADRLAGEALKKKQSALNEVNNLSQDLKTYENSLSTMENKVLELKNQIKKAEEEYTSLKARATVAKTTRRINEQLSTISSDSTMAMIEEMKTKIVEEENLAEAYGEATQLETSVDDEINKAIGIGVDPDIQASLEEMKRKLITTQQTETNSETDSDIEAMKKELDQ